MGHDNYELIYAEEIDAIIKEMKFDADKLIILLLCLEKQMMSYKTKNLPREMKTYEANKLFHDYGQINENIGKIINYYSGVQRYFLLRMKKKFEDNIYHNNSAYFMKAAPGFIRGPEEEYDGVTHYVNKKGHGQIWILDSYLVRKNLRNLLKKIEVLDEYEFKQYFDRKLIFGSIGFN
jgi:hypothetical protein